MKFNWGHGIALFNLAFVGFIVLMVVKAFQTSTDLTAENYYSQELAYGNRIEAIANANALGQKMVVTLQEKHLEIRLPENLITSGSVGTIHLYRPDNAGLDVTLPIDFTTSTQTVPYSMLVSGNYAVRVMVKKGESEYFFEEPLNYMAK